MNPGGGEGKFSKKKGKSSNDVQVKKTSVSAWCVCLSGMGVSVVCWARVSVGEHVTIIAHLHPHNMPFP